MSELDKLALNKAYSPVIVPNRYRPKLGETGLYYCGRKVMEGHNFPEEDLTDGYCGPNSGPNCTACRTIKTEKKNRSNQ